MKSLIFALAVLAVAITPQSASAQDCHKCLWYGELYPTYYCQNFGPIQDGMRFCTEDPDPHKPCIETGGPCGYLASIDELFTTPFGTVIDLPKQKTVSAMFGELLLSCNGGLVAAVYSPERAAALRIATDHIVI